MFVSRLSRGVSLGVVSAMMLGMLAGCKPDVPTPVEKTPQEKAAAFIKNAEGALAEDKITEAEDLVAEAVAAFADADVTAINAKIATAKTEKVAKELAAKVNALVADGNAELAKSPGIAQTTAEEALALDANHKGAKDLLAAAKKKLAEDVGKEAKEAYETLKVRFENAKKSKQYDAAIALIPQIEKLARKGAGASVANQKRGLENKRDAAKLYAEAVKLSRSRNRADWTKALGILAKAKQKDRDNRNIARLESQVKAKLKPTAPNYGPYNAAMAAGARDLRSTRKPVLQRAIRSYNKAAGLAGRDRRRIKAARDGSDKARKKISYLDNIARAKREQAVGNFPSALRAVQAARRILGSTEARNLENDIRGDMFLAAADKAEKAKDWNVVVVNLNNAKKLGKKVGPRLDRALTQQKVGRVAARVAAVTVAVENDNYLSVIDEINDLNRNYPENATIAAIVKAGPSKKEITAINKAALPVYKKAVADVRKKEVARRPQEKIRILETAKRKVRLSTYEKKLQSMIDRETTGIFSGRWKQVSLTERKMKNLDEKILYLQNERKSFKGTSFAPQLEKKITAAKTLKAAGAHRALLADVKKLKPKDYDGKISKLTTAVGQAVYKDTRYVKMIEGSITTAKNARARGEHAKLLADVKKLKPKDVDGKISKLEGALRQPVYAGTRYTGMIETSIKREKDTKARPDFTKLNLDARKKKTPQGKLDLYAAAVNAPIYNGTSLKAQIERSIKTQKAAIKTLAYNKLRKDVSDKKMTHDVKISKINGALPGFLGTKHERAVKAMLVAAKNAKVLGTYNELNKRLRTIKDPRQKIVAIEAVASKFNGTRYEKPIKAMITREKNAIAAKKYAELNAQIKKAKRPEDVLRLLQSAKQDPEIANSKYGKIVDGRITKQKTLIKSKAYKALLGQVNVRKPKALDSAAKVRLLQSRKAEFEGTTFEKSIDGMIKKYKGLIEREKKAKIAADKKAAAAAAAKVKRDAAAAEKKRKATEKAAAAKAKKALDVKASKVYSTVMKSLNGRPKTLADYDANIKKLIDAKQQVVGSSYVAKLDAQLKSQRARKAKLVKSLAPKGGR